MDQSLPHLHVSYRDRAAFRVNCTAYILASYIAVHCTQRVTPLNRGQSCTTLWIRGLASCGRMNSLRRKSFGNEANLNDDKVIYNK